MTLDINFELLTILVPALIFTILYFLSSDIINKIMEGFLSGFCWIILALIFLASPPTFIGLSYYFLGFGFTFIIFTFKDVYSLQREKHGRMEP